jgi:signal transduction histidine kinase
MSSRRSESPAHALGVRLAAWYACLFVGSSIAIAALTYVLLASSLRQRDREIVQSTLLTYATQYAQGGLRALDRAIRTDQAAGRREQLFVRVLDAGREVVFFSPADEWSDFDLTQLERPGDRESQWWASLPGRRSAITLEVVSAVLPDGTLLQVGKSTETRDELLARFRTVLLVTLTVIVVAGLVGGTALTRSTMKPLRELAEVVQTILETGRFDTRVPVSGTRDPLDRLSGLFNAMLDRIGALVAGMRGSLDNVAHDLRTPMMRLRAIAERALEDGSPDVPRYRDALADCLEESDRVSEMLNTLMDISEAETGVMKLVLEPLDVGLALRDGLDLYADLAEDKGVNLRVEAPDGLLVTADRNRLRQVIANLLDNAVKYTPPGGQVVARAREEPGEVAIEVTDTGPGIAPDDLPRIWDRLYRSDRSRSARGLGLGLSLVRAIVQAHGGRVDAHSAPGEGSTFTLHLPRA